jgi:hypothetical protein
MLHLSALQLFDRIKSHRRLVSAATNQAAAKRRLCKRSIVNRFLRLRQIAGKRGAPGTMERSNLKHRQINEKTARVVDQFEICVTMTGFGMVANAPTVDRIIEALCPPTLRIPLNKRALGENAIGGLKPTSDGPMIWMQMHRIIDVFVTFR